jgi:hypothetical protein
MHSVRPERVQSSKRRTAFARGIARGNDAGEEGTASGAAVIPETGAEPRTEPERDGSTAATERPCNDETRKRMQRASSCPGGVNRRRIVMGHRTGTDARNISNQASRGGES